MKAQREQDKEIYSRDGGGGGLRRSGASVIGSGATER